MRRLLAPALVALLFGAAPVVASISDATPSAATVTLPSVKGGFDRSPTISFPTGAPPSTLQVSYLHRGNGVVVKSGQLLVANYLGQIWRGKIFDNSFTRKQLSGFPIGVGAVIPGWDTALVGVHVGSRVLLVIPPAIEHPASVSISEAPLSSSVAVTGSTSPNAMAPIAPDPLLVRAGDRVHLWSASTNVRLEIEAIALDYGHAGQVIHLRRLGNDRAQTAMLAGLVDGADSAELLP